MIYSVWDPGRKHYDYFATGEIEKGFPVPRISARKLGVSPEAAAWTLPSDARHIGQGAEPKGMIAVKRGLGGFDLGGAHPLIVLSGLGLAAYGLYRIWIRPKTKKRARTIWL